MLERYHQIFSTHPSACDKHPDWRPINQYHLMKPQLIQICSPLEDRPLKAGGIGIRYLLGKRTILTFADNRQANLGDFSDIWNLAIFSPTLKISRDLGQKLLERFPDFDPFVLQPTG